jgi:hypothetical protein
MPRALTHALLFACILQLSDGSTANGDEHLRCTSIRPQKWA